jgi:hypothetical protein
LLWVVAYISMVGMLRGSGAAALSWPLANVALAWTHFYGSLVALIQLVIVFAYFVARCLRERTIPKIGARLAAAMIVIALGVAPSLLPLAWHRTTSIGGAWVPKTTDLVALFALWSVGLTAVRGYFLDGPHLVWPPLAPITTEVWAIIGALVSGLLVVLGMLRAWQADPSKRAAVLLAILLLAVPAVAVFGLATLLQRRWWALKPFLGAAYLYYLWGGVGLSQIRQRWLQGLFVATACAVASSSLIPYFTVWQKSDAAVALRSMPRADDENVVFIEPANRSLLARYYLGPEVPLWRVDEQGGIANVREITDILHSTAIPAVITCGHGGMLSGPDPTRVWLYSLRERVDTAARLLSSCFPRAKLWVFENNEWAALNR